MSNGTDNFPKMPPYPEKSKVTTERAVSPAESVPISEHPDVVALRRQDHEQACKVTHALMAERDHWKANHADVVARLKIATERHDLPVDRIPAIKELERLQVLAARQAPDLSSLPAYWLSADGNPSELFFTKTSVEALLSSTAQPLQQEGGK